jgi:hypothetical protein
MSVGREPSMIELRPAIHHHGRREVGRYDVVNLTDVSPILIDEAICMEQIAARLEQLLPAVRRRAGDEIALSAANFREFSGSVEAFHVASGDETIARLEQARRRLLAALTDPLESPPAS